jgi:hypothetical protein
MGTIHYPELLKQLEQHDHERSDSTFSMVYLDCNRTKRTGGNWVRIDQARKCGLPYHCADHEMRGIVDENGKRTAVHLRLIFEFNGNTVYP